MTNKDHNITIYVEYSSNNINKYLQITGIQSLKFQLNNNYLDNTNIDSYPSMNIESLLQQAIVEITGEINNHNLTNHLRDIALNGGKKDFIILFSKKKIKLPMVIKKFEQYNLLNAESNKFILELKSFSLTKSEKITLEKYNL